MDIISGRKILNRQKRLGYLSAAPRVSTGPLSEASGPRSHILGVIGAFEESGWEVFHYIVGDRIPQSFTRKSGMRLEKSWILRLAADLLRIVSGPVQSIRAWLELHNKVDLVYERYAVMQTLGGIFKLSKIPWVLETSGLYYYEATVERKSIVLNGIAKLIELNAYRRCDVLICVSEALKDLVIQEAGISPKKILVIPNGVDCTRFDPDSYVPERIFAGVTIGFVSALVRWHRLDVLLDTLGELHRNGVNVNLVVAGDGPMRVEWETLAQKNDLENRVRFLGHISWDEVPNLIAGFDIGYVGNAPMDIGVMYHSPLKMYEYMAMGKPVLAAENDDSRNMIIEEQNGFLFKAGEKNDLKRAILTALHNADNWKMMGEKARRTILQNASWLVRVRNMQDGIDRIISNNLYKSSDDRKN
jgi:glycosyltransferase involved in cell wall biosynthesis